MNKDFTLDKKNIEDINELTTLQQGMLFHYLKNINSTLYFIQLFLEIEGKIIDEYFEKAWNNVVLSNEMLRTVFRWEKLTKPVQLVLKEIKVKIRYFDLSVLDDNETDVKLLEIKNKDENEIFDLREVPFRLTLCKLKNNKHILLISNHHILYDGWSNGIILKEFLLSYNKLVKGDTLDINKKTPFKNFINQNKDVKVDGNSFWKDYLEGCETVSIFSSPRLKVLSGDQIKKGHKHLIPIEKFNKIKELCEQNKLTVANVLYATWGILLSKYSGKRDIVFGTTVSGRNINLSGIEDMVGLFINTIPLRIKTSENKSLIDIIKETSLQSDKRRNYENTSLENILKVSGYKEPDLFETIFVVENYPIDESISSTSVLKVNTFSANESTNYKLTVSVLLREFIELEFLYNNDFEGSLIEGICKHFTNILYALIDKKETVLSNLEIISESEKQQLLYDFNNTERNYPKDKTLHQLIKEHVALIPDSIALVCEDTMMTYRELDYRSGQLGNVLYSKGVRPGSIVGIMLDRSIEMLLGILSILKAGGAYCPIDISNPAERKKYILNDSDTDVLLTRSNLKGDLEFHGEVIYVDNITGLSGDADLPGRIIKQEDPAYIIYTSGSTGKPKGTLVKHSSVINLLYFLQEKYPLYVDDSYLLKTSYCFDVSISEIFGFLISGSKLVILEKNSENDSNKIIGSIHKYRVTHVNFVPAMFKYFSQQALLSGETKLKSLKYVMIAGEALLSEHLQEFKKLNLDVQIENLYGPTEATVYSTYYTVLPDDINNILIGKPVYNYSAYIVDNNNKCRPIGIPGELCLAGKGLAIGYLNNPELTSGKYINHPFKDGEKLYKTGDLARWLPDGNIEFLGRIDHQVKIRGFRIELGEIENILLKHKIVQECVVLAREDQDDKYLCAYIVSDKGKDNEELRTYLSGLLPDYMVPSYFVDIEEIPLTSNGKVNRKALPEPEIKAGGSYIAPTTIIESKLVKIWSDILNIPSKEISTRASFFELGGHSLKVTVLVSRIHKELDVRLELNDIFKFQTIQAQVGLINSSESTSYFSIPKAKTREYYPLSSSQRRLYLLQKMKPVSTAYNMPGIIEVPGDCSLEQITTVFNKLIARHENFRTSFDIEKEIPVQFIHTDVSLKISNHQIKQEGLFDLQKEFTQAFDLKEAPLFRVGYVEVLDGQDLLLVDMHHIISDGESHRILQEEFYDLLSGKSLPPLDLQYKDYSEWQNSKEQQERIKGQETYWLNKFEGELPVLELPTDQTRSINQSFEGAKVWFVLTEEETNIINNLCRDQGLTLNMSLLSIFTILLSRLCGQEDIVVGSPIAARRHSDLERIVGMFVNTLALRYELPGDKRLIDYLQDLKENTLEAYENQEYQFEDLVGHVVKNRDTSRNPLFDVMFNFLNHADYSGNLPVFDTEENIHRPEISKFDLTMTVVDKGEQLKVSFQYSTKLFKPGTIDRFILYFKQIINQLPNKLDEKLSSIEIITESEKQKLLYEFNDTEVDYPKDKTIHQLFEEQVERTPKSIALVFKNTELTFQELNQRSNQLSHFLISQGLEPGNIAGIALGRSIEMIVGILAVLKAGGAYCPIDINNPEERKKYILEDSGSRLLITRSSLLGDLDYGGEIVYADDFLILPNSEESTRVQVTSKDLSYLIYTSGTTGKPKGVMIRHGGVVNTISWYAQRYNLIPGARLLQLSNYSFDASVNQVFGTLTGGASLYMIEESVLLDLSTLYTYLESKKITVINTVPAILEELISNRQRLPHLQRIISGGENLSNRLKDKIIGLGYELHNHYGPTEGTIVVLAEKCSEKDVTLGKPKQNTQTYILSVSHDQLQPIGVKGELCISGEGISPGYLNNEALTKEKFVAHPFKKGERLYRTGDLARWLPDGNIEFLGRIDHQVKIRGYRIELGEIESLLQKNDQVKDSVVIDIEDENGEKYLCAYIVKQENFNREELHIYLSAHLPEYMIPSYFVELDKIPLTRIGKLDRKSLPTPEIKAGSGYVAPQTLIETKLVKIWSEVLNVTTKEISTNASFFELGGHSLKATVLVSRIHKELGVQIELREVFHSRTIQAQAKFINSAERISYFSIPKAKTKEYYPLSSSQRRLYLLQQMDLESTAYNMPGIIELPIDCSKEQIISVFDKLIARHENFRTSFEIEDELPMQRIHSHVVFSVKNYQIKKSELPNIKEDLVQAFDLSVAPLLRVAYLKISDGDDMLFVDTHHIISDGRSHAILEVEFNQLIARKELKPLQLQFKDYSEWQNSPRQQIRIQGQKSYWLDKFKDELPILEMPTDFSRPVMQSYEGASVGFILSSEETKIIHNICKEQGLTLYMSLLSIFIILLSKLSNQEDIVVGSPIAARRHADLEVVVGMFVNTLAIRINVSGDKQLIDYLQDIKENTLEAFENQEYQFEDLVDHVIANRDISRNPLFDVMFNLLEGKSPESTVSTKEELKHISGVSKFDLSLTALDLGAEIQLCFEYSTKLFKPETIERFINYFKQLIQSLSFNHEQKIKDLTILPEEEKQQLLYEFNDTKKDYPKDKTIHQLFEEQAEQIPDRIALINNDKFITYSELNSRSNQLGHILIEKRVNSEDIVGLLVDRSIDMLIGILGILKAGGVYLPLDPSYPESRIKYILENSNSQLILCSENYRDKIDLSFQKFILEEGIFTKNEMSNLNIPITPTNLCYVIYTSGSTGTPKGVNIEHLSVLNLLYFLQDNYPIGSNDSYLLKTSYCFDVSISELFGWIQGGGKLCILGTGQEKDAVKIIEIINKSFVTHINFVPSVFNSFTGFISEFKKDKLISLRYILLAGEALLSEHLKMFKSYGLDIQIVNLYGPTEATVYASHCKVNLDEVGSISIGRPISNYEIFILDKNLKINPLGVSGELLIGGKGLARNYLNNPDLTSEKFIDHPFKEGEKLYRTGDLARWLPDGNIEFLGRLDHQVKIRGFRIELGEIENALHKHENIKECVVIDIEDKGDKYLSAYLVTKEEINKEEIRIHLSSSLPDYMIPSYFVELDSLPLNSNGKINRKGLPLPEIKAGNDYVAPSNETEEKLVEIWSEVLKIEKEELSTIANFFSIGGHSLKASLLTGRIHKETGVEFPLRDVFLHSSIQAQADQIKSRDKKDFVPIPKAEQQEYYPLSSAQKRLYLLQEMEQDSTAYNMPYTIPLGTEAEKNKIEEAFRQFIARHESFRTSFKIVGEEPVQRIHQQVEFKLEELTITKEEVQNQRCQFIQAFNLSHAPLLRAAIVNIPNESSLLMIDMHHIISDGVSHSILEREFQGLNSGEELAPLNLQYKDYSEWQNSEEQQIKVKEQEDYWIRKFEEEIPVLNLPIDKVRPAIQSHEGASVSFTLSNEETQYIKSLAKENGLTLYMSVLSVFYILLSKLSGQEDIIVGTPIAGRNHRDLENIVGMFVNTLAIRNEVNRNFTLKEFVEKLKRSTLEAFENQNYQFEELVEKISIERDISRNPIFDVMFNLLNQLEHSADLTGIDNQNYIHNPGISKFDLTLTAVDYGEQLLLSFEYCIKLFNAETIERFIRYFKQIVTQISQNPERELSEYEIISAEEKQQILYAFNDTQVFYPSQKSISQVFDEQVKEFSKKIALEDKNNSYTYQELDEESNKIANYLIKSGVTDDQLVGLMAGRSSDMIIGILGILKTGCAYVPIDPAYPKERVIQLIQDSGINILLTEQIDFEYNLSGGIINIRDLEIKESSADLSLPSIKSSNIAYVMYTSGSTGTPKGVVIEQKSVLRLVKNNQFFPFHSEQKILLTGAPVFDATTFEIWGALLNGGSLYIASNEVIISSELLGECIRKNSITSLWLTSSLFNQLVDQNESIFDTLKFLLIGGDVLSVKHINKIKSRNSELVLINGYGPTENTTFSTTFNIEREYEANIPIGKPISNSTAYIFDKSNKLQAIGVSGELLVGGDGLAREYLKNQELTQEKFIKNPYKPEERLYRTGDLARWLPDGNIEFLGRIDHQVKIRGFRIELGEIESVLQKHENIKESIVLVREENGEKYLCAYLVAEEKYNQEEIRTYLSASLPDYMIPSYFVQLEKLPLTSNGKIDRKALPLPEIKAGDDYVAPSNETEEKLVEIWSEVLNIEKEEISVAANFFDLGGNSLKITLLNQKINNCFNTNIEVAEMFRLTTIKSLTIKICKNDNGDIITAISDDNIEETVDVMDEYLTFMESEEYE